MFRVLKAPLVAMMLSSVALVPAATIAFMGSADVALAKSENSGGNGGGKGSGGKNQSAKSMGKSENKSSSSGGGQSRGHKGLDNFFDKLLGKKAASSRTKSRATAAGSKPKDNPIHASNRGNMNGALHANENAIAAHIRNGNTNGPVGLMAAYVTARSTTANALATLGEGAGDYTRLNDLLVEKGYVDGDGNPDLQAYIDTGEPDPELETALTRISWSEQERLLVENAFVDSDGNPDFQAYESYRESGEAIQEIEDASTEPGGFDDELYASVNESSGSLDAEGVAAQALIDYWNKKGTASTETEEQLRLALEARAIELEMTGVVADALPEPEIEEVVACEPEGSECSAEEELALTTE